MRPHRARYLEVLPFELRPFERVLSFLEIAFEVGAHLCHPLVLQLFLSDSSHCRLVLGFEFLDSF